MAVTDLSGMSDLPWWARQASGVMPGGGVMNYQGSTPGAEPGGVSWLDYLSQMFGVSPAQAGTQPNPNDQLRAALVAQRQGQQQNGPPVLPTPRSLTGGAPPQPAYNPLAGWSANTGVPYGAPPQPTYNPLAGGSANTGGPPANVPAANAQPVSAATPNPALTGGAGGVGAMSNPRFIGIDRPNAPAGGSPYGRGGPPQMTALNLAGLFGGGGPGATGGPAAAPQGAGGRIAGPMAQPSMADLYPFRQIQGSNIGDLYPAATARGATPGPYNPQIASALRQPNWFQNLLGMS